MSLSDRKYLKRETWSLTEAACLLADEDPAAAKLFPVEGLPTPADHVYANLKDATDMGGLDYFEARTRNIADRRVRPWDVVAWARARGDEVPEELNAISEPPPRAKAIEIPPAEKPLTTSERHTLLTIIAALCEYSAIKHQERGAAIQIARLTDDIGATVSDDTVRRHLSQIPVAIEARKK